jgi:oligopeptide/dipeptide ABC transporter ATP-binding protein
VTLLEASDLSKTFYGRDFLGRRTDPVRAVDRVSLSIDRGETLGLVGESGSGKSTLGRLILRLVERDQGTIRFDGVDIGVANRRQLRSMRQHMQMVFQDPYSSLDPKRTIGTAVAEPLQLHTDANRSQRETSVDALLQRVGLSGYQNRFPYELSGGQLQRIAIARAIATEPKLIVCDEPVAALDVSVRAQVMNLLQDLQEERAIAYLFISHDLSLVRNIAQRVAVMYLGRIVEVGAVDELFVSPLHPYTQALLRAIPVPDPRRRSRRLSIERTIPRAQTSLGCLYAPRCPSVMEQCWTLTPTLGPAVAGSETTVACHLHPPRGSGDGATADPAVAPSPA